MPYKRMDMIVQAFVRMPDKKPTPVETQACGTPIIVYGKGGSLETVVDSTDPAKATGLWFHEQTVDSLMAAVQRFESLPAPISAQLCRQHVERFSIQRFRDEFADYVNQRWNQFQSTLT